MEREEKDELAADIWASCRSNAHSARVSGGARDIVKPERLLTFFSNQLIFSTSKVIYTEDISGVARAAARPARELAPLLTRVTVVNSSCQLRSSTILLLVLGYTRFCKIYIIPGIAVQQCNSNSTLR